MTSGPFADISPDVVEAFWDGRPCNIRHSPRPLGTREYFDEVEARKYRVEPHIVGFADFAAWRGKKVLEIGCGIGTDTTNFARAGARVTAVDLSRASLDIARRRADIYGVGDRITFHHANAESLADAVPIEAHDLIYSFGVIHHTPRPERALAQMRAFLHPGGIMKIMVYHLLSTKVAWIVATKGRGRFWEVDRLVARHSEAQTGCPVTHTYTRRQAVRLVESQGLAVTDLAVDHIFPYRLDDYLAHRYVKVWHHRILPRPVAHAAAKMFGWHLLMTARLA
jgi:ubiquinone/menaquinone biosynthesis C-methylase UbiE